MNIRKDFKSARGIQRLIWVLTGVYGVIFLLLAFNQQQQHFGKAAGTVLSIIELTVPLIVWLGYYFWKRKRERELMVAIWIWSGIILAFLGWFAHPSQIYERAIDRLSDWEKSGVHLEESIRESKSNEDASLYARRFQEELYARKLELEAAEVRFNGEPQFFRSTFVTWSLWFFSLVCFYSGIAQFFSRPKNEWNKLPRTTEEKRGTGDLGDNDAELFKHLSDPKEPLREETPRTKRKDKRKGGDNKEQRKSDKKEETNVNNKKICKYCEGYGELPGQTGDDKTHVKCPYCAGTGWTLEK